MRKAKSAIQRKNGYNIVETNPELEENSSIQINQRTSGPFEDNHNTLGVGACFGK
jgi:hypothetical protein